MQSNHNVMITEEKLRTIWQGCIKNDRKAQELLYRTLASKMLAVCIRYTNNDRDEAQDILQEGFIKVFNNVQNFRGEGSLEGWIRRIMVHAAISRYRKQKSMILTEDIGEDYDQFYTGYYHNQNLEIKELLRLIQELPDNYRAVFNMHAIEGYSHQEIASTLGMSELASRTSLHRARLMLQNKLQKMEMAEEELCMAC